MTEGDDTVDLADVEQAARRVQEAEAAAASATIDAGLGYTEVVFMAFLKFASNYLRAAAALTMPIAADTAGLAEEYRQALYDSQARQQGTQDTQGSGTARGRGRQQEQDG